MRHEDRHEQIPATTMPGGTFQALLADNPPAVLIGDTEIRITPEQHAELKARCSDGRCTTTAEMPETFTFDFQETNDPRKGKPYVAKIQLDAEGKLDRVFMDLEQEWGRKEITVHGTYTAQEGDIIEIRTGGSWKNDYREFFIVYRGEQHRICSHDSSTGKIKIKKYLKGEVNAEDFVVIKTFLENESK